jgi:hypothetical protein
MKMFFLLALCACVLTGCVHPKKIETINFGNQPRPTPIRAHAALVLDEQFKETIVRYINLKQHVGQPLQLCAESAVRRVFQHVDVYASPSEAAKKADVILIPRVVQGTFEMKGHEQYSSKVTETLVLTLEWVAKDIENGKIIWLDTLSGGFKRVVINGPFDFGADAAEKKLFQDTFDDLARKTEKVLLGAREIQQLSKPQ